MSGGNVVDGTEILVDGDAAWAAVAPWESAVRMDKDPDPEDEPLDDKPEFDDEFGEEDLEGQDGDFEDEDDLDLEEPDYLFRAPLGTNVSKSVRPKK